MCDVSVMCRVGPRQAVDYLVEKTNFRTKFALKKAL